MYGIPKQFPQPVPMCNHETVMKTLLKRYQTNEIQSIYSREKTQQPNRYEIMKLQWKLYQTTIKQTKPNV